MEELTNLIVNNGIGVGSFIALLYFANNYIKTMTDTLDELKSTLSSIKESLVEQSNRISNIEEKLKEK